jgi:carotenoid cleavage dioxygenase-like enzyme
MTQATAKIPDADGAREERVRSWIVNAWRPDPDEREYEITEVEGKIPREIHGTLFRNGPSQRVLPKGGYEALHLFDGDALVHAFRFDDGRVHYRGRFVRNQSFLSEQAAGRVNQNLFTIAAEEPTEEVPMRRQPNTNVVHHGGKLMALVENAYPFEIDARSLEPVGENDFQGRMIGMSVTAHPKIDGRTGQMIIHGYQPFEPYVQLYVVEADGTCSLAEPIAAPYPAMMHDVALTENHVVFILPPVFFDGEVLLQGGLADQAFRCEPERGLRFGVRSRAAGGEVRWFDAPTTGFIFHPGNAYEKDGKIYMDACTYLDPAALFESLRTYRSGRMRPHAGANPFLYELDLAAGTCRETKLGDVTAEFPRLDDRLVGYENRYGYAAVGSDADGLLLVSEIVKYDRRGGASASHSYGEWQMPNEPVFVPRSPDAGEDDGFVLNVVYDGTTDGSYVAVLDARDMAGKPLAKAHLKHRVPMGFHGNFVPGMV